MFRNIRLHKVHAALLLTCFVVLSALLRVPLTQHALLDRDVRREVLLVNLTSSKARQAPPLIEGKEGELEENDLNLTSSRADQVPLLVEGEEDELEDGDALASHSKYAGIFDQLGEVGEPTGIEGVSDIDPWADPPSQGWQQCIHRAAGYLGSAMESCPRYLAWLLDGGISQQAWEIANSVAVARVLNATFILPELKYDPFWKDSSSFEDVFEVEHFQKTLAPDVRVILRTELPPHLQNPDTWLWVPGSEEQNLPQDYTDHVLPLYKNHTVLKLSGLDGMPWFIGDQDLEQLRCRARFEALRFAQPIRALGDKILQKLRQKSPNGKVLALHLRFEEDMIAFNGCKILGTNEEQEHFAAMRKSRGWPEHAKGPEDRRREGQCPPPPGEVAKWLRAMGYSNDTVVFLAAGKLYQERLAMGAFYKLLPNSYSKQMLLDKDQWATVAGKNNILAAIDIHVLIDADVSAESFFGVMRLTVAGFRRWQGFKLTLQFPNWAISQAEDKRWPDYVKHVREWEPRGEPVDRYKDPNPTLANPMPDCMCQHKGLTSTD